MNAVEALQQIVTKMGAKWLNSSADPCTDEKLPIPPHVASVEDKNNTVFCNCFFDNQTTCHITTMYQFFLFPSSPFGCQENILEENETNDYFDVSLIGVMENTKPSFGYETGVLVSFLFLAFLGNQMKGYLCMIFRLEKNLP